MKAGEYWLEIGRGLYNVCENGWGKSFANVGQTVGDLASPGEAAPIVVAYRLWLNRRPVPTGSPIPFGTSLSDFLTQISMFKKVQALKNV
jgi:hypothetical protein